MWASYKSLVHGIHIHAIFALFLDITNIYYYCNKYLSQNSRALARMFFELHEGNGDILGFTPSCEGRNHEKSSACGYGSVQQQPPAQVLASSNLIVL